MIASMVIGLRSCRKGDADVLRLPPPAARVDPGQPWFTPEVLQESVRADPTFVASARRPPVRAWGGLAAVDGEVVVAAVADEELASLGIAEVLTHLDPAGIDGAVVTEPTERQADTAHRGFAWTEVTVTGVAAHGSRPHLGADAILAAGHHLASFDQLDQQLRGRPHPFLGPDNLHASLISGGTGESTIPDRCVFTVERRTLPGRPSNASRPTSPT